MEDLRRRSPLTYAGQISAPLLVVQGANDPRVPRAEADQIVKAARDNGTEVEYLLFENEGHGLPVGRTTLRHTTPSSSSSSSSYVIDQKPDGRRRGSPAVIHVPRRMA